MEAADPRLEDLQKWVEQFCEAELRSYLSRLQSNFRARSTREFNDPVWQTISLTPFEAIIADNPLFQRLRRIRQLGVVHWVYPGAVHTRFDHSLGTLHQIQQLVDAINRSMLEQPSAGRSQKGPPIGEEDAALLRFAALCHDLGHGVMSHVSENALSASPVIEDLMLEFQKQHHGRKSRLGEMVAYYVVGSAPFRELVEFARNHADGRKPPHNVVDLTQKAIVGDIVYPELPLLQELISGPFDADKLDYMQRDALMTGIPAITDVARLAGKVRSTMVERRQLPEGISKQVGKTGNPCLIFGMAFSGTRALDELLLARVLLFDKVYRHQKVRALEGMVARLLEALAVLNTGPIFALPYSLTDELLLDADRLVDVWPAFARESSERQQAIASVQDLCSRLRERRLFVRASVFGEHFPGMPASARRHMVRLLNQAGNPADRESLTDKLATEIKTVLGALHREEILDTLSDKTLRSYLWIDPPSGANHAQKIVHAFLIREGGGFAAYQEHSPEVATWSRAYLSRKEIGLVFCIPELLPFVTLAMEGLLAREYTLSLPVSASDQIKDDSTRLDPLREELRSAGYYHEVRFSLRPEPQRLRNGDVVQLGEELRANMEGYQPPDLLEEEKFAPLISFNETQLRDWLAHFREPAISSAGINIFAKGDVLDREEWASIVRKSLEELTTAVAAHRMPGPLADERIRGWLAQFEDEKLITFGLRVLSKMKMIGRPMFVQAVRDFCHKHPVFDNGVLVALGDARDSGRIVTYLAQDAGLPAMELEQAMSEQRPILFVDDFIGSGSQATGILADWFGETEEGSAKLGEKTRRKLRDDQIECLKTQPLAYIFAAGWRKGAEKLRVACLQRQLRAEVHVGVPEETLPTLWDADLAEPEGLREAFCQRSQEIARQLLRGTHPNWDLIKLNSRLLGYGNRGLLITFPYNTPTQTLTCMWASGTYQGVKWTPLHPRRPKQ